MKKILTGFVFSSVAALGLSACGGGSSNSASSSSISSQGVSQNVGPISNAGVDQDKSTGSMITLSGMASSDADGDVLSYQWSLSSVPAGSVAELINETDVSPSFMADMDGTYTVQLVVSDGTVSSQADTVTIVVSSDSASSDSASSDNAAPMADAGPNQNAVVGTVVTLSGMDSADPDGDMLTYEWVFNSVPDGSAAALVDADSVSATFTPDLDGTYIAQLVVSDGTESSVFDLIKIVVSSSNSAPVANAGPNQNVSSGSIVTLSGADSSDVDGDALTYEWTLNSVPTGSATVLVDADTLSPTFTPDLDGAYIAQLVVNDGIESSVFDLVKVIVSTSNSAPVADAGPNQNVATGAVVTLSGIESSDVDGDMLTYEWTLDSAPAGSVAKLIDSNSVSPTFTPDLDGVYIVQLIVSDGADSSEFDLIKITASTSNSAPIAEAGQDQHVAAGEVVTLDGTASSDADGDVLTYQWSLSSIPTGSVAVLSGPTAVSPTFTADIDGTYIAQLIVNDGTEISAADIVEVVASTTNSAPVADAGHDQFVQALTHVVLDGSASSDADGDGLVYTWAFVSRPAESTAMLNDSTAVNPSFAADLEGSYVLSLVVNDGVQDSVADTVQVDVVQPGAKVFVGIGDPSVGLVYREISLADLSRGEISVDRSDVPEQSIYRILTFKILAQAGDITITNLSASDPDSVATPSFAGIANNNVIADGEEREFELISTPTGGVTVHLNFSFEILETGEVFSVMVDFTSRSAPAEH